MKSRLAALAFLFCSTGLSFAQAPSVSQNYCLNPPGGQNPALQHCVYATLQDCEAKKKNETESCVRNPYLTFPNQEDKPRLPAGVRE